MRWFAEAVEGSFQKFAGAIYGHPFLALLAATAVFCGSAAGLGQLRLDTSMLNLFHEDDPTRVAFEEFQELFGSDDVIIVLLEPPDVFDAEFLAQLRGLHSTLDAKVPYLDGITSLLDARKVYRDGRRLVVEDLLEEIPDSPEAMAQLREIVLADPLYRNTLVSADGRFTALVLVPDLELPASMVEEGGSSKVVEIHHAEMLAVIDDVLVPLSDGGVGVWVSGNPVVSAVLGEAILADMGKLVPMTFVAVILLLSALFRRVTGVVFPLAVVGATVVSTMGVMGTLGIALTNVTTLLPTLLMVVGIADSVHVLTLFYQCHGRDPDKRAAIVEAFAHSGPPVLLTSFTTAAAFASFAVADVAWVTDLGVAAPIGVLFALFYTVVALPALIALVPVRHRKVGPAGASRGDRALAWLGERSARRAGLVVAVWVLLLAVAGMGFRDLRLSQMGLKWFPEGHRVRTATETIDEAVGGSLTLEILIDSGREQGLYDADLMLRLDRAMTDLEGYELETIAVGKCTSVTYLLKEIHRALSGNDPAEYRVPDEDPAVAEELLLLEMNDDVDLGRLVSPDLRIARITLSVPFQDGVLYIRVIEDVEAYMAEHFSGEEVSVTGMTTLFSHTIHNILNSMARSYPLALGVITVLMMLLLGLRLGLLSMVPNVVPLLMVTGLMGWCNVPFDFSTMLVGGIALGLVVDDTMHFLHGFGRAHRQTGRVDEAVRRTLTTTGKAMLVTSMTLVGGFLVYSQATLRNLYAFGLLAAVAIALALLADFTLVPAILALIRRRLR